MSRICPADGFRIVSDRRVSGKGCAYNVSEFSRDMSGLAKKKKNCHSHVVIDEQLTEFLDQ